jgi:hypothetical protein
LAGIDDAHYYHAEDFEKVGTDIPQNGFAVLLSHTPEVYSKAAEATFDF